jgi:hypothetical protein
VYYYVIISLSNIDVEFSFENCTLTSSGGGGGGGGGGCGGGGGGGGVRLINFT